MDDMGYDYELAPLVAGDPIAQVRPRRARALSAGDGESGWGEEILGLLERPEWHRRAACSGMDVDLWFPVRGDTIPPAARAVCAKCPVRSECLEAGLREKHGIWSGTSERQRRGIRTARRGDAA